MGNITIVVTPFLSQWGIRLEDLVGAVVSATDWVVALGWLTLCIFEVDVQIRQLDRPDFLSAFFIGGNLFVDFINIIVILDNFWLFRQNLEDVGLNIKFLDIWLGAEVQVLITNSLWR
jgi:hypothetical protein